MFEKTEEFHVVTDPYPRPQFVVHALYHPNLSARLAIDLSKHLAVVAIVESGEDSAGRQKVRLLTPSEVALRVCDIADSMMHEFNTRGWLQQAPPFVPQSAND